jgi:hypothetical protein
LQLSGTVAFSSPTTVEFHGGGHAQYLGRFMDSGVAILGQPTGGCADDLPGIPNAHIETVTAANGDQVVIRMVNLSCPTGPSTFHGAGSWKVFGGTGRFEGVSGEGTYGGDADFATGTFVLTLTGTLRIAPA